MEIYTIGFTQTTAEHFFGRLKAAGIQRLLDVRLACVVIRPPQKSGSRGVQPPSRLCTIRSISLMPMNGAMIPPRP